MRAGFTVNCAADRPDSSHVSLASAHVSVAFGELMTLPVMAVASFASVQDSPALANT